MLLLRLPVAFALSCLSACAATEQVLLEASAQARRVPPALGLLPSAQAAEPARPSPKPKLAKRPAPPHVRVGTPEPSLPPWSNPAPKPSLALHHTLAPSELFRRLSASVYAVVVADRTAQATSQGSAVAVTARELITNCHVVSGGGTIRIINATAIRKAEIVAADLATDRCVLRVDGELQPVQGLREHASLQVGEAVFTIASPKGLVNSLGQGILSGLRRAENGIEYVQVSAPVSSGSSGGGLFDDRGNLIGIVTFTIRDAQNLNFAIAASEFWKADKVAAAHP